MTAVGNDKQSRQKRWFPGRATPEDVRPWIRSGVDLLGGDRPLRDHGDRVVADLDEAPLHEHGAGRVARAPLLCGTAPGDADRYRAWLSSEGKQAENTIRRLCGRAKEFFRAALRQRLIRENPFADMKKLVVGASPKHRVRYIDRARMEKVLAACPNDEWRLIVALARYGGFRIPSELVALKWEHIDWEAGQITVTSIKTEHHEGHETRETPIFPELRPYLEKWRDKSPRNEGWVFSRRCSKSTKLRTPFLRILRKAKVKPWPKLFQNHRSSRETELLKEFPVHVVCAWLGNTPRVALKHYAQVTDEDFKKATRGDSKRQAG